MGLANKIKTPIINFVGASLNYFLTRSNVVSWPEAWGIPVKTASNQVVNAQTAITLSAVYACVDILSSTISSLPFGVYTVEGNKTSLSNTHQLSYIIGKQPNDMMTRMTFMQSLSLSAIYRGNGYAYIHRNGAGIAKSLEFIHPDDIKVLLNKSMTSIVYEINSDKYNAKRVSSDNMIHVLGMSFNGVMGVSVLEAARQTFGIGLAELEFQGSFLAKGATLSGTLTQPGKVSKEQMDNLKKSWDTNYGGSGNTGKTAVLENGMEFKPIGIKPIDAQFLEGRKFSIEDIARFFNVPLHLIKDLTRSTNNNIEQQSLEFVQYSLRPWLKRIEAEFDRKLLTEAEKRTSTSFTRFNVDALLRGDVKTRAELYKVLNMIGALDANEIRTMEGWNAYDGGDTKFVQANMIPVDRAIKGETNTGNNE